MKKKTVVQIIIGLMLIVVAFFNLILNRGMVEAVDYPDPSNAIYIYDETDTLSQATKNLIVNVNKDYEKTAEKPQIAVVVVNSLEELSVAEYASQLFNKWGIGQKSYDNGVLLLLAPEEGQIRIEVGYGLEDQLTDSLTGAILDKYLPLFSDKEFDYGTLEVFKTLVVKVNDYYGFPELATIPHYDVYRDVKEGIQEARVSQTDSYWESIDWVEIIGKLIVIALIVADVLSGGSSGGDSSCSSSSSSSGGSSFGGGSSGGGGSSRSFYRKGRNKRLVIS